MPTPKHFICLSQVSSSWERLGVTPLAVRSLSPMMPAGDWLLGKCSPYPSIVVSRLCPRENKHHLICGGYGHKPARFSGLPWLDLSWKTAGSCPLKPNLLKLHVQVDLEHELHDLLSVCELCYLSWDMGFFFLLYWKPWGHFTPMCTVISMQYVRTCSYMHRHTCTVFPPCLGASCN